MVAKEARVTEQGDREKHAAWIRNVIAEFVNTPENTLQGVWHEPAWGTPLVGFARGDDPIWTVLKEDIGSFYWTPAEIFALSHPSLQRAAKELTVISWVLPQTERTKSDHRKKIAYPSERWARSRKYGEDFNVKLRAHLVKTLLEGGCEAVAPQISPLWRMQTSEKYGLSSTWSERHAAYAAGLGTFGLCDGLITFVGKAMRTGSVVARINVTATPRPYEDFHAYCLFFSRGDCGRCAARCPVEAITKERGHDKARCQAYVDNTTKDYISKHFGFEAYGCGLCQVNVPCESGIPE
jgi:epoxyqueuosine reductase QueG